MSAPTVSFVIRARNEAADLPSVLDLLAGQTFKDFDVLVVDDSSTDGTGDIARGGGHAVVELTPGSFTYPEACNVGAERTAGRLIAFVSAHSYPISSTWLADGVRRFDNQWVAGVYCNNWAQSYSNPLEKAIAAAHRLRRAHLITDPRHVRRGVLGFNGAIIRRDLWERHRIDERYAGGCEDAAWARYWIERGYAIAFEPRFAVRHSHGLSVRQFLAQQRLWSATMHPSAFRPALRSEPGLPGGRSAG